VHARASCARPPPRINAPARIVDRCECARLELELELKIKAHGLGVDLSIQTMRAQSV
jgi:hypothetical protein